MATTPTLVVADDGAAILVMPEGIDSEVIDATRAHLEEWKADGCTRLLVVPSTEVVRVPAIDLTLRAEGQG